MFLNLRQRQNFAMVSEPIVSDRVFVPNQNNSKTSDTSYKMDLDFLYCFGGEKVILQ